MNAENKIINTEEAFQSDPFFFLGILAPDQIKPIDPNGRQFEIAKDSEVLIEGLDQDGKHTPLVIGALNESAKVHLLSIGRNVRLPENRNNVTAAFHYDLSVFYDFANDLKRTIIFRGKSTNEIAVELFFLRHNYFGLDSSEIDITNVDRIHILANLPKDPRQDRRAPSSEYRFRKPETYIHITNGGEI